MVLDIGWQLRGAIERSEQWAQRVRDSLPNDLISKSTLINHDIEQFHAQAERIVPSFVIAGRPVLSHKQQWLRMQQHALATAERCVPGRFVRIGTGPIWTRHTLLNGSSKQSVWQAVNITVALTETLLFPRVGPQNSGHRS